MEELNLQADVVGMPLLRWARHLLTPAISTALSVIHGVVLKNSKADEKHRKTFNKKKKRADNFYVYMVWWNKWWAWRVLLLTFSAFCFCLPCIYSKMKKSGTTRTGRGRAYMTLVNSELYGDKWHRVFRKKNSQTRRNKNRYSFFCVFLHKTKQGLLMKRRSWFFFSLKEKAWCQWCQHVSLLNSKYSLVSSMSL